MNSLAILVTLMGLGSSAPIPSTELAVAPVEYRITPREYRLDGVVEAVNHTTVSAQTRGLVQEILYDVDDTVEKGAVVVRLRDTEQRAALDRTEADLAAALAHRDQADVEFRRVSGLYRKKAASKSMNDKARAERNAAHAEADAAQARLDQAREQLSYTEIRAPYDGIVSERHVEVGEVATPGAPVMSGVSLDSLRVTVDVPQSVIPLIRRGGAVRVYLADDSLLAPEKVTVFPYADRDSNTFEVRATLPSGSHGLYPGMYVKTGFVTGERQQLTVPVQAVVHRSEVTGVYVVGDDGRINFRQGRGGRRAGHGADEVITVLAGLNAGEQVALDPIAAAVRLKAQRQALPRGDHGG